MKNKSSGAIHFLHVRIIHKTWACWERPKSKGRGSRDHPRTQIQITCTHRARLKPLRSPAHAAEDHMYTPASPRSHVHTSEIICARMNERMKERTNERMNESDNQPINQSTNQSMNQSINQLINESRNP